MFYIRFTTDIHADVKKGYSKDMRNGKKLSGLCAWNVADNNLSPYAPDNEIIESAKKTAQQIAKNTYGGYGSNSTYAVLEGQYVGSSNDGVCIKVIRVISIENL
jgi:hypothetical protein